MKRIISIIAAAVLLAGCAANSGKTPMPPAWALGFWTIADRNTDADDIAEGVSALRNAERPADAFVIGAGAVSGFSSSFSLESIHKLDARVAVDLRGKPEGYWKRVMKKFNADTWIVDNPADAEELLAEASKGNKRPFLLSAMDPGKEMLGVARMISAGKGWEGLRDALKEGLDLSRNGVPFWAVEPADSTVGELLIRSLQLQTFFPIPMMKAVRSIPAPAASAIAMRYTIMPYVYSVAYGAHKDGKTMATPLDVAFPDDPKAAGIEDEFMFGDDALVCPVLEAGVREREVYLPAGYVWYNYVNGEMFEGGTTVTVSASLDDIPVFCPAGGMILATMAPSHYYGSPALIHAIIYPGKDAEFDCYVDDGLSTSYLKNRSGHINIKWNELDSHVTVSREGRYKGMQDKFQVIAVSTGKGSVVIDYSGEPVSKEIMYYK